jgi:DNA invertase Pin-like site-specific DNA recombinase
MKGVNPIPLGDPQAAVDVPDRPLAAIWARISDPQQRSLDGQVADARVRLEADGFEVPEENVFAVDWHSEEVIDCPDFQRLFNLVNNQEISAVGIYDRDRLSFVDIERLTFFDECHKKGVRIVLCQGPEFVDGDGGRLLEIVWAMGKKAAVLRARSGSSSGLARRVKQYHLPTSRHKIFGMQWETNQQLICSEGWDTVALILKLALESKGFTSIINELSSRAIPSPAGHMIWPKATVSAIIHNPVYAGRYYGLKKIAQQPKKRKISQRTGKITSGNTSHRLVPVEDQIWIKEIKIVDPVISWDEHLQIKENLTKNMRLAQRNPNNKYLLTGMIFCGDHFGKNGEPRIYHGQPRRSTYRYRCPVGGCATPSILGPDIEANVKATVSQFLLSRGDDFFTEYATDNIVSRREGLQSEDSALAGRLNEQISLISDVYADFHAHKNNVDRSVYESVTKRANETRLGVMKRRQTLADQLAVIDAHEEIRGSVVNLVQRGWNSIDDGLDNLDFDGWQNLLKLLDVRIHMRTATDVTTTGTFGINEKDEGFTDKYVIEIRVPIASAVLRDTAIGVLAPG